MMSPSRGEKLLGRRRHQSKNIRSVGSFESRIPNAVKDSKFGRLRGRVGVWLEKQLEIVRPGRCDAQPFESPAGSSVFFTKPRTSGVEPQRVVLIVYESLLKFDLHEELLLLEERH